MNIREFIQKLEIEKQKLADENKQLKKEIAELKMINKKLVDDWNSTYYVQDSIKVVDPEEIEEPEKRNLSDDENTSEITSEEVDNVIEEEQKPKRSRRKKDSEDSGINLM